MSLAKVGYYIITFMFWTLSIVLFLSIKTLFLEDKSFSVFVVLDFIHRTFFKVTWNLKKKKSVFRNIVIL
jgi:hypothetical protein